MNKKLINVVKGDIESAITQGTYSRNTQYNSNIEFDTAKKQILLDGQPYSATKIGTITEYQESTPIAVGDTYDQAISKLIKIIKDNERVLAEALTELHYSKPDIDRDTDYEQIND